MADHEWTAEQIEAAIPLALQDGNMEAVESLIRMLAVRDPHRAEVVIETMKLGLAMRNSGTA